MASDSNITIVAWEYISGRRSKTAEALNALFIFSPDGSDVTYRKRQLVPFAELSRRKFLRWLPYVGTSARA